MPPATFSGSADQYSQWVGSLFIFNLIVGTGALTIPFAFSAAGWVTGTIVIVVLAFMSYVTVTFIIESMAAANAILQWRRTHRVAKVAYELPNSADIPARYDTDQAANGGDNAMESLETSQTESQEDAPLLENTTDVTESLPLPKDFYSIQEKVEMGQMVSLYFNKVGIVLFYICICVYLYGDLAIYCAAVSKSLRDVVCTHVPVNFTCNMTKSIEERCWSAMPLSRANAYRVFVVVFLWLLGPFVFFNVQKTKYLQILTSLLRWIAFWTMIILAIVRLAKGKGEGKPELFNLSGIPHLFGVCVYSFMCHHSLPSLVTPIANKRRLSLLFAMDYYAILVFYMLLAFTGIFTFRSLQDLYTLNFQPDSCSDDDSIAAFPFISYLLALFPVFTLSTNFPIIGITLRNNLQALFANKYGCTHGRVLIYGFPLLTIIPPAIVALATERVELLVGFTGSYAGTGIQYVIPAMLVYKARKMSADTVGQGVYNTFTSPFRSTVWVVFVLVWAATSIILVTVNNLLSLTS